MREHWNEPVRGLPERLPEGEEILWQGAPDARRLAREAFHVRLAALYFAVMLGLRAAGALSDGRSLGEAAMGVVTALPLAAACLGILFGLAWLQSRSTVYTVTTRRVVIRYGAAVPKAVNLPLAIVESAAARAGPSGAGDLVLKLKAPTRIAFLHLWPHVRPHRWAAAEPAFRALADARPAAEALSRAAELSLGTEAVIAPAPPLARPAAPARTLRPAAAAAG